MTLAELTKLMMAVSVADVRAATKDQRDQFSTVADGIIATIVAENAYDETSAAQAR